jgi:hypothetical protein
MALLDRQRGELMVRRRRNRRSFKIWKEGWSRVAGACICTRAADLKKSRQVCTMAALAEAGE